MPRKCPLKSINTLHHHSGFPWLLGFLIVILRTVIVVFFFNWSLLTPFQGASLKGPYTGYWKTRNPEKKQEREWEQEKERKKN